MIERKKEEKEREREREERRALFLVTMASRLLKSAKDGGDAGGGWFVATPSSSSSSSSSSSALRSGGKGLVGLARKPTRVAAAVGDKTVLVVGAGINGLCTTARLLEHGYKVTCVSEVADGDPSKGVASGGAGGLWFPYLCESSERTGRWANETRLVYEKLLTEGTFEENGVAVKKAWQCYSPGEDLPPWAPDCPTFKVLSVEEVEKKYLPGKPQYAIDPQDYMAYSFEAPIVQVDLFLKYLRDQITSMGGEIVQERVNGPIEDLEADVLVNCAALGNAATVEGLETDELMKPVRGQIIHCENKSHITEAATISGDGESAYMIPRGDVIVYGGTSDEDQWDLSVDDDAVEDIIRRCRKLLPEAYTKDMKIVGHWVGLRPFRQEKVNLEKKVLDDGRIVVNNYGHGGSGFTLCYGCADEVVRLASE